MSNELAIASVTAVLKDLLNNSMIDHDLGSSVGEVLVSALPPDRVDSDSDKRSRLNLFMYQVTSNPGWRNSDLPSHNARGERVANPPLALDLHYLLTAYGAEEFHGEILLGYGMQLFHETPVLPRAAIRKSLAPPSPVTDVGSSLPPALQKLFTSGLAEQVELIKICPQTISTEEISRMWTAFQAKYRPTAVYQVTVVLIESQRSVKAPLPVRRREVYVTPFRQPYIEQLLSQQNSAAPILANQPILAGYNLVIAGKQLQGDVTTVTIGGVEVAPAQVSDTQIVAAIPASLQAGLQGVQVIQQVLMGSPPAPHRGVESNLGAFVLRPQITAPVTLANLHGTGSDPRSADVTVQLNPLVGDSQRVLLMLNKLGAPGSPPPSGEGESFSFTAASRVLVSPPPGPPGTSAMITIPITGVPPGDYLVRVQVDGAESPLDVDASGRYVSPQVTIP